VVTYVVRVWLPDRPGALGQVASRIGAVHGDVIGIDILERGGGSAIDELTVSLPRDELVDLLIAEIRQVDGVAVEDVRRIDGTRPDAATAALAATPVSPRLPRSDGRRRSARSCAPWWTEHGPSCSGTARTWWRPAVRCPISVG
jgi:hypothetical protein